MESQGTCTAGSARLLCIVKTSAGFRMIDRYTREQAGVEVGWFSPVIIFLEKKNIT